MTPSVKHRQEIGGDICLTTLEKKETFDLQVRNWRDIAACAEHWNYDAISDAVGCHGYRRSGHMQYMRPRTADWPGRRPTGQ